KQERRAKAVMAGETLCEKLLGSGSAYAETDCTAGRLDKPFVGQALPPADFCGTRRRYSQASGSACPTIYDPPSEHARVAAAT
ncbi:MAG: hypothetical protein C5B58_07950, partial [Acidobacteria bacterium]